MAIFKNYFQFESIIHNFEIVVLSAITLPRDQKINHEERDDDLHGAASRTELCFFPPLVSCHTVLFKKLIMKINGLFCACNHRPPISSPWLVIQKVTIL